jgi:glutamyl-Q tRNA(Asp) synthetase
VASFLEARVHHGKWLVRIEDIDPPREQRGAAQRIIRALEAYGFEWDDEVTYQSGSRHRHDEAVQRLLDAGLAYPCGCSRRQLADAPDGPLGKIYPGTCRNGCAACETAIRVRTTDEPTAFIDRLQGKRLSRLETESGDFVIRRRDGLIAYQLAVVVDDALQNITEVVRGIDLIDSTPRQVWLQKLLGYRTPAYAHIPVVVHADGDKLSKLTGAAELPLTEAPATLVAALRALRQAPPADLDHCSLEDIWLWALNNWKISALRGIKTIRQCAS